MNETYVLDDITGEDALRILKKLCADDSALRTRVMDEARRVLADVDVDAVSEGVLLDLESLCVQELWDRSGPRRDGYSSPDEMAVEMFEEAIHPHEQEIEKYRRLGIVVPCMLYVMGTLKGIYRYEKESESEFKDWATDVPAETFGFLLDRWRKDAGEEQYRRMSDFIREQCPDWAGLATRYLTTK